MGSSIAFITLLGTLVGPGSITKYSMLLLQLDGHTSDIYNYFDQQRS
jgi:hypothetical protein